jgi:hypothetical protein
MVAKTAAFSTPGPGVLSERAGEEDVVVAAPAHRTARQAAGGEFGAAARAATPQDRQRRGLEGRRAVDGNDRSGALFDQQDVVVLTAVLVAAL